MDAEEATKRAENYRKSAAVATESKELGDFGKVFAMKSAEFLKDAKISKKKAKYITTWPQKKNAGEITSQDTFSNTLSFWDHQRIRQAFF